MAKNKPNNNNNNNNNKPRPTNRPFMGTLLPNDTWAVSEIPVNNRPTPPLKPIPVIKIEQPVQRPEVDTTQVTFDYITGRRRYR